MKNFKWWVGFCLFLTYLVILAGAIVRGTGSGLGCPDWPRCFGQWIPPTNISELPLNYKEEFKIAGKVIADFDPYKTWTEYINRLLGAVLGFMLIILFIKSFKQRHLEANLPWFTGGLLFLVIVQGAVGALVVMTHLKPFIITFHMFLATVLIFGLIYLRKYTFDILNIHTIDQPQIKSILNLVNTLIFFIFLQIIMGTQVRQMVDHLTRDTQTTSLDQVISSLDWVFYLHRSFSLILIILALWITKILFSHQVDRSYFVRMLFVLLTLFLNIFSGIKLNYFNFPPEYQPPHLFFALLGIGLLYNLKLHLKGSLLKEG